MSQLHQLAQQHKATKVIKVKVSIGRLSGIVADSFSFGFETLSGENSLTKNAVLEITETEPVKRCLNCGFIIDAHAAICPECFTSKLVQEGGNDLVLTQVEME